MRFISQSYAFVYGVSINFLRLDEYFSCGKIIQEFGFATILFLLPKKNIVRLVFGLVFLFGWWFWRLVFCLISGGLGVLFGSGGVIGRGLFCFLLRFT
jgi:hypothetical protein